ncbi:hypothetical protein SDC9_133649 [bioreactor metagenome]|uniref:TM2 domain-containing protein n=1 Tax=bioreactor metagenome TaxID=1076179 RepID=A0A645DAT3_9ZZZZ|nr:hypothetical protein [Erysipelotrichaceae bacterium]
MDENNNVTPTQINQKGNTGLVLGILGIFFFHLIFGILALVFSKKDKNPSACIALGIVDLVIWIFVSIWQYLVFLPRVIAYLASLGIIH